MRGQEQYSDSRGTTLLRDAVRMTEESQTIANSTSDQLYSQRNQLQGAHDQIMHTRDVTKEAHQKIVELQRRLQREKVRNKSCIAIKIN
jgi:hypothetical protein